VSSPTVAAPLAFRTPPARVRLTFDDAGDGLRDAVATTFRCFPAIGPEEPVDLHVEIHAAPRGWQVDPTPGEPSLEPTRARLLSHLVSLVTLAHIEHGEGDVHLHAGGVVVDGRAVLVVGASGSGKSTLVAGLVQSGRAYLSDEAVGVRADGRVLGHPKPLTVKAGAWPLVTGLDVSAYPFPTDVGEGHRWEVPPDALGMLAEPGASWTTGLIVLPTWSPDLDVPVTAERLPPAAAVLALGESTFDLGPTPAAGLVALGALVAGADVHRLRYRDTEAALAWIDDPAEHPDRPPLALRALDEGPATPDGSAPEHSGWLRRTAPSILLDDRAIVFVPAAHRLMALDAEASRLWARIGRSSAAELIDSSKGPPLVTADFLASLTREGVVAGWTT
jgi:hypothetical protein